MKSLDIVIPTYNEEKLLPKCLESLNEAILELKSACAEEFNVSVIVVDAGSTDKTVVIAEERNVEVLYASERGRGNQFQQGVKSSNADFILMLHADSEIERDGLLQLYSALKSNRKIKWGILGHSYTSCSKRFKWVQFSNYLRFVCLGIAFGDQGIFVKREALDKIGGMPEFRLMEDVELSLRLRSIGPRAKLNGPLKVSARRWERKGSLNYTIQVISLVLRYLTLRFIGADLVVATDGMYKEYYES